MIKVLATCAALATLLALPDPAAAAQRPDGFRNSDQIEVSSARRPRRYYRSYARPYWGPGPYYYRPYYRPYYYAPAPWPFPFVGPFWW